MIDTAKYIFFGIFAISVVVLAGMALTHASPLHANIELTSRSVSYTLDGSYTSIVDIHSTGAYVSGVNKLVNFDGQEMACDENDFLIDVHKQHPLNLREISLPGGSYVNLSTSDTTTAIYIDTKERDQVKYAFGNYDKFASVSGCSLRDHGLSHFYVYSNQNSSILMFNADPAKDIMGGLRIQDVEFKHISPQSLNKHNLTTGSPIISGRINIPSVDRVIRISSGTDLNMSIEDASLTEVSFYKDSLTAKVSGTFRNLQTLRGGSSYSIMPSSLEWCWENRTIYMFVFLSSSLVPLLIGIAKYIYG